MQNRQRRSRLFVRLLTTACCLFAVEAQLQAGTLTGTIIDAETGKPLPARVYLISGADKWHYVRSAAKEGTAIKYDKQRGPRSYERHTTVSAHPFTAELPPGRHLLIVERGKEYHPETKRITIGGEIIRKIKDKDGKEKTVKETIKSPANVKVQIELQRWVNMAKRGWYSGDTHVHRSLAELPNVMLAEDLNVALPLTHWVTRAHTPPTKGDKNSDVGSDPKPIAVDKTHVIYPLNTEYEIFTVNGKRHTLGAVFILNHKKPLPMGTPPVGPIATAARKQGALLDLDKHSWPWSLMLVPVMNVDLFELSNNHVWRTEFFFKRWTMEMKPGFMKVQTDDIGMTEKGWVDFGFGTYYALLNCGFRLRPTAGTASGVHPVPLGFGRVYVEMPEGFSYEHWMKGLDAGRSFVTTGPMLFTTFNGKPNGHTFKLDTAKNTCRVRGTVECANPLSAIEIIVNGEVVRRVDPENLPTRRGAFTATIDESLDLDGSSWVAVRCWENYPGGRFRFAHSAPVYFDVKDKPLTPKKAEVHYFVRRMQEELERNKAALKPEALNEYRKALQIYREIEERAR